MDISTLTLGQACSGSNRPATVAEPASGFALALGDARPGGPSQTVKPPGTESPPTGAKVEEEVANPEQKAPSQNPDSRSTDAPPSKSDKTTDVSWILASAFGPTMGLGRAAIADTATVFEADPKPLSSVSWTPQTASITDTPPMPPTAADPEIISGLQAVSGGILPEADPTTTNQPITATVHFWKDPTSSKPRTPEDQTGSKPRLDPTGSKPPLDPTGSKPPLDPTGSKPAPDPTGAKPPIPHDPTGEKPKSPDDPTGAKPQPATDPTSAKPRGSSDSAGSGNAQGEKPKPDRSSTGAKKVDASAEQRVSKSEAGDQPKIVEKSMVTPTFTRAENGDTRVESTSSASSAEPLPTKQVSLVIRQIADRMELLAAAKPRGGVTIQLEPAQLGNITMTVKLLGGSVEAHISASDDRVRTALEQNRPLLGHAMEQRGIKLENVSIASQTQSSTYKQPQSDAQQNRQHPQHRAEARATPTFASTQLTSDVGSARRIVRNSRGMDMWI